MVLESIIGPIGAERRPWLMVVMGFVYASFALILSLWIFESYASLVMVFLTVLACSPLMYRTIKMEEKKDLIYDDESKILFEHSKALGFLLFLFVGITFAYAFWYMILPADVTSNAFSIQAETITRVNSNVTGSFISGMNVFSKIFFNNLKVMIFCLLFSLTYGLGAIFILVWNASIIGVALGNFIRSKIGIYSTTIGLAKAGAYLHVASWGILRYSIHGIPEIAAYFIAGLAGGIISIAIVKHDFGTKKFEQILLDTSDLIIIAILVLIGAAAIETWITPVLF